MRYVIFGAGAVGGTIGYRLHDSGHDVLLIARGAHLEKLQTHGMTVRRPDGEVTAKIPAVGSPQDARPGEGDVVVLSTKTQDSAPALSALAAAASPGVAVVCAQNAVENERLALRYFERVYALVVMLPAAHIEAGVIHSFGVPVPGILDVGRYPRGVDQTSTRIAQDLQAAGFRSQADAEIMRKKYYKLVTNIHNAVEAIAGFEAKASDITDRARSEALTVLAAAGISVASAEEDKARRAGFSNADKVAGSGALLGNSSWQSLARRLGSIETDYLNGEIVMLGRLHGVPTPINLAIQQQARRLALSDAAPGSLSLDELRIIVDRATVRAVEGRASAHSA